MTERRDFKRIVRARARRTGESYSSALRQVRNARLDAGPHEEVAALAITRTIPDIRSTAVEKTTRFYTEVLGFDTRVADGRVAGFVSPTDRNVEVTLNRDGFSLPPGFTIEVDSVAAVGALYGRRHAAQVRTIDELEADGAQFSVLDPSGRRVTIAAGGGDLAPGRGGDVSRSIREAIPGVGGNDPAATRRFYVDFLGFELAWEVDGITMFRSPAGPRARVIASTRQANPDGFDLMVGSLDRLDELYRTAQGRSIVLHRPADFPDHGIRCFLLLDPNGIAVNVAARLDPSASRLAPTVTNELAKAYERGRRGSRR